MGVKDKTDLSPAASTLVSPPARGVSNPLAQFGNENAARMMQLRVRESGVRFSRNDAEVTEQSLLDWAIREHVQNRRAPEDLVRSVQSGREFEGSQDARQRCAQFLAEAIRQSSLAQRYATREALLADDRKDAAEQHAKDQRERDARIATAERDDLEDSMSALDEPDLLPIYQDWLMLHGLPGSSQPGGASAAPPAATRGDSVQYGHRMDSFNAQMRELRVSVAARLQAQSLDLAAFDKQITHAEEAFRAVTLRMGIAMIDRAEAMCQQHLQNIDALSGELFTAFASVREPVSAALGRARRMVAEGPAYEMHVPKEPKRPVSAWQRQVEAAKIRKSAYDLMGLSLGEAFPFIAWPDFPRDKLARCDSRDAVRSCLTGYFHDHLAELARARDQLRDDSTRIYKLDLLLATAQDELEIESGSILEDIIHQQVRRASQTGPLEAVETALAFALAIVTLVAPVVAPVTLPASAALSVHGAVNAIENYGERAADYRAGLSSDMPSMGWVILALAGAALDAPVIMKFLRFSKLWEAVRNLKRSRDLGGFSKELGDLPESLPRAAREALEKAAREELSASAKGKSPGDGPGKGRRLFGDAPDSGPGSYGTGAGSRSRQAAEHERLLKRLSKGIEKKAQPPADRLAYPVEPGLVRGEIASADEAYEVYNTAVWGSKGRPVVLLYHPERGVYEVVIGTDTGFAMASGEGWHVVTSFRPQGHALAVSPLPSYEQVMGLYRRYTGLRRVREFIEHDIPGVGRGRTEFGFNPAHPEAPFYVRVHRVSGWPRSKTVRFADPDAYAASLKR